MADEFVVKDGFRVGDVSYPSTDGTTGQVLKTDGSGTVSFQDETGGSGTGSVERVRIDYAAGFDINSVTDETSGVTTTITNATDSIISMDFTGHTYPPVAMLIYAFDVANNRYTIEGPPGFGTGTIRFVEGGDTNFGDFSNNGPITLQVDENNLALNPDGFTGPHAYILMWFLD